MKTYFNEKMKTERANEKITTEKKWHPEITSIKNGIEMAIPRSPNYILMQIPKFISFLTRFAN
jgi:hypothetical protein